MSNLEIFCITNKPVYFLENTRYNMVAVGKNEFPSNYIRCDKGDNIFYKEQNYSELTFHYWFWKNRLNDFDENTWIVFCQKRRFWLDTTDVPLEKNIQDSGGKNIKYVKSYGLRMNYYKGRDYKNYKCAIPINEGGSNTKEDGCFDLDMCFKK